MKITQRQLRQIIKEELARTNEMYGAMPPRRFGATPEEVQKKIDFYLGQGSRMWMMGAMSEYEDMASGGDGFTIPTGMMATLQQFLQQLEVATSTITKRRT